MEISIQDQEKIEGVVSKYVRLKQTEREILTHISQPKEFQRLAYSEVLAKVVVAAAKIAQSAYDDSEGDCIFCGAEQYPEEMTHDKGCQLAYLEQALVKLDKYDSNRKREAQEVTNA